MPISTNDSPAPSWPKFVVIALAVLGSNCQAEEVYKCVKNGKTQYLDAPKSTDGVCKRQPIYDDRPSPEELARLQEQQKSRQEEDLKARQAELKEREIRAQELEASAATRRARAEEEQVRMIRRQQSQATGAPQGGTAYLPYYPMMNGRKPRHEAYLPQIPQTPPLPTASSSPARSSPAR